MNVSGLGRRQVVQRCPNCSAKYDVGIYVSGQKVRCRRCGIKFAVVRSDTQMGPAPPAASPATAERRDPVAPARAATPPPNDGGAVHPLDLARVEVPKGSPPAPPPRAAQPKQNRVSDVDIPFGSRLAGYEIGTVLGKGAMGVVNGSSGVKLEGSSTKIN